MSESKNLYKSARARSLPETGGLSAHATANRAQPTTGRRVCDPPTADVPQAAPLQRNIQG